MKFFGLCFRVLLFSMVVFLGSVSVTNADAPSCPECAEFDPNSTDYEVCVVVNDCSDGVDVPVNGNLWVLAMAGFVFAFVKFGGHTKLAGYYYSRFEKRD